MHRSSTFTSENSPKQFKTNMFVDCDGLFSLEAALLRVMDFCPEATVKAT